jgi:serine/threonine protein kinase
MTRLQSNLQVGASIGSGHFGDVHLGQDDVHGEMAVKILRQGPGESDADWRARKGDLLAEGQRLSRATHRNVVQVYQLLASSTDDAVLLVMEYCSGGSLQKSFDGGPMPLEDVRRHSTEIAFGLHALHARGMLHRDIKPGNLLIDRRGVTKLGDFGLVTDNLILGYGSAAGYLDHLAPEVHACSPTSAGTDIWALGMTIYRLLHGSTWYAKSPPPKLLIPTGGFAKRLRWLPHIPKPWRRFVWKALHDDSGSRYQNAGEVGNALATLPTGPGWRCSVTASHVSWVRWTANRQVKVFWTEHSSRRHEWKAWSEPVGTGRTRALGGSKGLSAATIWTGSFKLSSLNTPDSTHAHRPRKKVWAIRICRCDRTQGESCRSDLSPILSATSAVFARCYGPPPGNPRSVAVSAFRMLKHDGSPEAPSNHPNQRTYRDRSSIVKCLCPTTQS